ncbi:MAG: DUF4097 family beta strand repeat-containing protein [Candidatus Dormibacteria bacterium]
MASFETPHPIAVALGVGVGRINLTVTDRTDTVVEVHPTRVDRRGDVALAERTRVELNGDRLSIVAPHGGWRQYVAWGDSDSVDVRIDLPAGSSFEGDSQLGDLTCTGSLGECRYKTGMGVIQIDGAATVRVRTGLGNVNIATVRGDLEVSTGSGSVRVGHVSGDATIKSSNGDISVGEVGGALNVRSANGGIGVDRAQQSVVARTANGSVRIGEVESGSVEIRSACGKLDIGVAAGVCAWLDLTSPGGVVRNELHDAPPPQSADRTVEVKAHTGYGDIFIRRADGVSAAPRPTEAGA